MTTTYTRGTTYFELSNHASTMLSTGLGNVLDACAEQAQPCLSIVTDRKLAQPDDSGQTVTPEY